MAMQINYMVKVLDAKLGTVKKALTEAGIEVVSLVEVFKEETGADVDAEAPPADP
ncbi:MAG: hypothetical protein ACE5FN_02250 [Leptospirillia bacterium]